MAKALNPITKHERTAEGVFVPVWPNAGAHNSIYRGKSIQDRFADGSLYTAVADGSFDDLFIGDWFDITIDTSFKQGEKVRCLLAGFDVFWGCGDQPLTKHHAVIVPLNGFATAAKMNAANDTTGSYVGSDMYKTTLPIYATAIKKVFTTHLITSREYMGNAMNPKMPSMAGFDYTGATTAGKWLDCELRLMNEVEVYGSNLWSSSPYDAGMSKTQLPLFRLAPARIIGGLGGDPYASTTARTEWWLSAVASAACFANVHENGLSYCINAGNARGVRPRWLIG